MKSGKSIVHKNTQLGDVNLERVQTNVRDAIRTLDDCPFLHGRLVRVSFTAGVGKVVSHSLGVPASFMPIRVENAPAEHSHSLEQGCVERSKAIGTWTNGVLVAPGQTNGARYRLLRKKRIVGARFIWRTDGATHTMKISLWDDASGVQLRTKNIDVNATGIYEVLWDSLQLAVGADFTLGIYNATIMSWNTDNVWRNLVAFRIGEDLQLQNQALFSANDARPTTGHGTAALSIVLEPILARAPIYVESEDQANLDLKNQLRVEASESGKADLWFYPRTLTPASEVR